MSGQRNRENGKSCSNSGSGLWRGRKEVTMDRESEREREREQRVQRENEMMILQRQENHDELLRKARVFNEQKRTMQLVIHQARLLDQQMALRIQMRAQAAAAAAVARTNTIDRLLEAFTPRVTVRHFLETRRNYHELHDNDLIQYYNLKDLWESYEECSANAVGVKLTLIGNENVTQYYVPSLSRIQLYVDPANARMPGIDTISQRMSDMSMIPSSSTGDNSHSNGKLIFEYNEIQPPHVRMPLFLKISELATTHADLNKLRSCDLLPTSWMSVAWYPTSIIGDGERPCLKKIDTAFLTFHHLSTRGRSVYGSPKMSLPVFGLASYKLKNPILTLQDIEQRQADSLFQSAKNWIELLHVNHKDFDFFLNNAKIARD